MNFFYIVRSLFIMLLGCFISAKSQVARYPPTITKQPDFVHYYEYNISFALPCEAVANPTPNFTWFKDGDIYDDDTNRTNDAGTILFASPNISTQGLYQCMAENYLGKALSNTVYVQQIELSDFKNTRTIVKKVNKNHMLTLECDPPAGNPKPIVNWMKSSGDDLFNINSSRLTVDPEGNLHFAYVKQEEDEYSITHMAFVCIATSINQNKKGPEIRIETFKTHYSGSPLKLQYSSPNLVIGLKGKTLELYCIFGGFPLPDITWKRKLGNLQHLRFTYSNFGKTLVINKIRYEDADDYICEAVSGENKLTKSIKVLVSEAPYWINVPLSEIVSEGDNVTLKCLAGGDPKPKIKWFKNGKPIKSFYTNRTILTENSLRINNVTIEDIAVYQCNASNVYGYIFRNFYLNIVSIEPKFIYTPFPEQEVLVMSEVTFNCSAYGVPKPEIRWFKDGMELTGENFEILEQGHLRIKVVESHQYAGRYTCMASNKFGQVSTSTNLIVRKKTQILEGPEDTIVNAGDTVVLQCRAIYDPFLKARIVWYFEGRELYFDYIRVFLQPDKSLYIIDIRKSQTGNYTCVVETPIDSASKSGIITIALKPESPKIVSVECKDKTALIKWEPRGESYIEYYSIQYNTSFEPHIWNTTVHELTSHDHAYEVELSPWANFTFRVLAVNTAGTSEPSLPSKVTCRTSEDVPYDNPRNVKGEGNAPNNMIISWIPMKLIEQNAPGFFYKVYWKREDYDDVWQVKDIKNSTVGEFEVTNTPVFKPYLIKVEAYNRKGQSNVAATVHTGYSGEDKPTQAPKNFTLISVENAKTAKFKWSPVPPHFINGHFKGYKMRVRKAKGESMDTREVVFDRHTTEATVTILHPFSENLVTILVYNSLYEGPPSEELIVKTPEGTPDSVDHFAAMQMGSSAFYLLWSPPTKINGILRGYKISYQEVIESKFGELIKKNPLTNTKKTNFKLSGLKPNTTYRIFIAAFTNAGDGQLKIIEKTTRPRGSRKPDVPDFDFYKEEDINGTTFIRVIWKPAFEGRRPGSHFYVQYRKKGETNFLRSKDELDKDYYDLNGMDPEIAYELRVVSVDGYYQVPSIIKELLPNNQNRKLIDGPKDSADWLIGILCTIALVLVLSMLVCIVKRNRGGKYSVHNRERSQRSNFSDDARFKEYSKGAKTASKDSGSTASLTGSLKQSEKDADSITDYEDRISKFGEDGSFIGQYVPETTKDKKESSSKFSEDGSFIGQHIPESSKESIDSPKATFV